MARYIHLYNTDSDFSGVYYGDDYNEPWLSFTIEAERINYNKSEYEKLLGTPLTFKIISAGTINWVASNSSFTSTIEYKLNDGEWTEITSNTGASAPSISVNDGDEVKFRGDNTHYTESIYYNGFRDSTAIFEADGNIMSLIDSDGFVTATTLTRANIDTFSHLFACCTGLTSTEKLILPATTLANGCYYGMFSGCTNLTTAPELPATALANYCYSYMFYGCTRLTTAPELPATTLTENCYKEMFARCASLVATPELPAITYAGGCCWGMFSGCTSLTTGPSVIGTSATTMGVSTCREMFAFCTSLEQAPALPATTLANQCYQGMFYSCTTLTTAPELPATTLANHCYAQMFSYCSSLTSLPHSLPATTLKGMCYIGMFADCTSITTAPELPATTLESWCYQSMFSGCKNLSYIKCLATDISANATTSWVVGVASVGTFVKPSTTDWSSKTGYNGIPANWNVEDA